MTPSSETFMAGDGFQAGCHFSTRISRCLMDNNIAGKVVVITGASSGEVRTLRI